MKQPIVLLDWEKSLSNLDVNNNVSVFNEVIMNIFYQEIFLARKNHKQIKTRHGLKNILYKRLKRRMLNSVLIDKLDALQVNLKRFLIWAL